jgi:hypothetical protein
MAKYLLFGYCIIGFFACNPSPETKQKIEKGKELAKQVKATVEHLDLKNDYIGYEAHPDSGQIRLYWKDNKGNILGSLQKLKSFVEQRGGTLRYACNGGMYMENRAPLGYYIENGKNLQKINTRTGSGNFYMAPKGVFYVLKNGQANVQSIETAKDRAALPTSNIRYSPKADRCSYTTALSMPSSNPAATISISATVWASYQTAGPISP